MSDECKMGTFFAVAIMNILGVFVHSTGVNSNSVDQCRFEKALYTRVWCGFVVKDVGPRLQTFVWV